jgi:hypothetical protein
MYFHPIARMTLSLLVLVAAQDFVAGAADGPGNLDDEAAYLSGTRSPEELAGRIAKLLPTSTGRGLDRLVTASDCTTALAAGWERVRQTMPETKQEATATPDPLGIARFLGLIEGRLRVPVPKAWEEVLKSARGQDRNSIYFPPCDLELTERRSRKWMLEREGANWLVKQDKQVIKLPAEAKLGPISQVTVECVGNTTYAALYGSSFKYRLFAIDQSNGRIMWSSFVWGASKVWPAGVAAMYSGSERYHVNICSSGETLVVFGLSGLAMYIEVFDCTTGVNRCRFSTEYFNLVSRSK